MAGSQFTRKIAEDIVAFSIKEDELSKEWSQHVLLDWLGVAIAGSREPSSQIVADYIRAEGGSGPSTVIGTTDRTAPHQAALANGVAAHALDFDDTNILAGGHASAPIVAATVALAEREQAPLSAVLEAVAAGVQAQATVCLALGESGYSRGFHSTGTLGTFGVAAACGHLLSLDEETLHRAFGLSATQAAGLKASFGTMGKHLNAAKAATNGLLSVELARRGFTAAENALEAEQGFAWTHSDVIEADEAASRLRGEPAIRSNNFKWHACCHGTHSAIEGASELRRRHGFEADDIESVELRVPVETPKMCGIPEPRTGLEGKFSIRYTTALALADRPTGPTSFTDEAVNDAFIAALRDRVTVVPTSEIPIAGSTHVTVRLKRGTTYSIAEDFRHGSDSELSQQWQELVRKFTSLAAPVVGDTRAREVVESLASPYDGSVSDLVRSDPV
jgi:2-methylcitrate dehydratase PrpD